MNKILCSSHWYFSALLQVWIYWKWKCFTPQALPPLPYEKGHLACVCIIVVFFFIFITEFCVALRTASIKCGQSRALIRQIVFHLENHTFMLPHFIFFLPLPFDLIYSYTYRQPPQWSGVRWQSQFFCSRQRTLQRLVLDNLTKVLISSWEYHPILCLARLLCPGADSTVK